MPSASLLEKMASIKEGSSCRVNARLTKRSQAAVLNLRKKKSQEAISIPYNGEGGAEDVPLLGAEVVAMSTSARLLLSTQPS